MWVGGMRMSMMATAGAYDRTLSSRSSAVPLWPTTSNPASSSRRAMPSRSSTESSARTTRMRAPRPASFASDRNGGKLAGAPGSTQLEDPLGLVQAAQVVLAEVVQLERAAGRPRRRPARRAPGHRARRWRCARHGGRRPRRSRRRSAAGRRCECRSEPSPGRGAPPGSRAPRRAPAAASANAIGELVSAGIELLAAVRCDRVAHGAPVRRRGRCA